MLVHTRSNTGRLFVMFNSAAWLNATNSQLEIGSVESWKPGKDEILIEVEMAFERLQELYCELTVSEGARRIRQSPSTQSTGSVDF
jgi:hypothetical protein